MHRAWLKWGQANREARPCDPLRPAEPHWLLDLESSHLHSAALTQWMLREPFLSVTEWERTWHPGKDFSSPKGLKIKKVLAKHRTEDGRKKTNQGQAPNCGGLG